MNFNFKPCAFQKWTRLDSWPVQQAVFVLMGYEPPPLPDLFPAIIENPYLDSGPSKPRWSHVLDGSWDTAIKPLFDAETWNVVLKLRDLFQILDSAVKNNSIPHHGIIEHRRDVIHIKMADAVSWARSKGFPLPAKLRRLGSQPAPLPSAAEEILPAVEETLPPRTKGTLLKLVAALCVVGYGALPTVQDLQKDCEAKSFDFDPGFLKDTLEKAARKLPSKNNAKPEK